MKLLRGMVVATGSALLLACAGSGADPDYTGMSEDDFSAMGEEASGDYLRRVVVRDSQSTTYLMHWPKRKMPLQVYLPPPTPGLFENPDEVEAAVRAGVLVWADVVEPGVPSFEFVEDQGDADIPFVWAAEPTGDWFIAFSSAELRVPSHFGISHILVTGRWQDGRIASLAEIHETTAHEMGHALGLMGHSDDPADIMWPYVNVQKGPTLSPADVNTLRLLYEHGNRRFSGRRGGR